MGQSDRSVWREHGLLCMTASRVMGQKLEVAWQLSGYLSDQLENTVYSSSSL